MNLKYLPLFCATPVLLLTAFPPIVVNKKFDTFESAQDIIIFIHGSNSSHTPFWTTDHPRHTGSVLQKIKTQFSNPFKKNEQISYFQLLPKDLKRYFLQEYIVPHYKKNEQRFEIAIKNLIQADKHLFLKRILQAGVSFNPNNDFLSTALEHECSECATLLLKHGANPHIILSNYDTMLMQVIKKGQKKLVRTLLKYECNPNECNESNGKTPLFVAVEHNDLESFALLLTYGARINFRTNNGSNLLHIAARLGNHELINFLLAHHIPVNVQDAMKNTPLHYAAGSCQYRSVVRHLITQGADCTIQNISGQTAAQKHSMLKEQRKKLKVDRCITFRNLL
jgi:hypothetical protein